MALGFCEALVPHIAPPETAVRPLTTGSATPLVFAIILNYRTAEMTLAATSSLLRSRLCTHHLKIIVVDNGSGPGEAAALSRLPETGQAELIPLEKNRGFAGGNNAGIERIAALLSSCNSGDEAYVLLMNSDVTVEPDALQRCLDFLRIHPDAGVVGPKVLLPDGRLDLACRRSFPDISNSLWKLTGLARLFPGRARFAGYNLTYLDEDETAEVDSVMGAFMLVRWPAVAAAGLLDDAFFMYGEDLDWSYRIKAHGWKVFYFPEAEVTHLKGATTRRQSNRMIYEFYRSMWLFHRKHYARSTVFVVNWLILAGIIARGLLAYGRNLFRPTGAKRVS